MKRPTPMWGWTVVVMGMIFVGSTDWASQANTARYIDPVLQFLVRGIGPEGLQRSHIALRTLAHVGEYALLGYLIARSVQFSWTRVFLEYPARLGCVAFLMTAVYASADEFHQAWIPSRTGCWSDVVLDAGGALLGIVWALRARR